MDTGTRAFFTKTIRDAAKEYGDIVTLEEAAYYAKLVGKGMTINEVNIADFKAAIAPFYTNNDLKFSVGLRDRLSHELGL